METISHWLPVVRNSLCSRSVVFSQAVVNNSSRNEKLRSVKISGMNGRSAGTIHSSRSRKTRRRTGKRKFEDEEGSQLDDSESVEVNKVQGGTQEDDLSDFACYSDDSSEDEGVWDLCTSVGESVTFTDETSRQGGDTVSSSTDPIAEVKLEAHSHRIAYNREYDSQNDGKFVQDRYDPLPPSPSKTSQLTISASVKSSAIAAASDQVTSSGHLLVDKKSASVPHLSEPPMSGLVTRQSNADTSGNWSEEGSGKKKHGKKSGKGNDNTSVAVMHTKLREPSNGMVSEKVSRRRGGEAENHASIENQQVGSEAESAGGISSNPTDAPKDKSKEGSIKALSEAAGGRVEKRESSNKISSSPDIISKMDSVANSSSAANPSVYSVESLLSIETKPVVEKSLGMEELVRPTGDLESQEIIALTDDCLPSDAIGLPQSGTVEKVKEKVAAIGGQVADSLPEPVLEVATQVAESSMLAAGRVSDSADNVVESIAQLGQAVADQIADALPDSVVDKVGTVAEAVGDTVSQISESVSGLGSSVATKVSNKVSETAGKVVGTIDKVAGLLLTDEEDDDSDEEFDFFTDTGLQEYKGLQGMNNFEVKQENDGILAKIHDFYIYMLKVPAPVFAAGMFITPIVVSLFFTLLYLPDLNGLALDDTAQKFFEQESGFGSLVAGEGLESWRMLFQVFMFSISLATGLQPELAPLTPYTLVVANTNALVAELVFVFLSGAVFARLSQPSQPIKCSKMMVISPPAVRRRNGNRASHRVLMARYVLVGPQPLELVDVKIDLTYKFNTVTRSGSYFRSHQSLKLVRPEVAYQTQGMLVRHVIDETSPLYGRSQAILEKEDAIFSLSVVGLERLSMQSVFHVEHYSAVDKHLVWDAEFEDLVVVNKRNQRVINHRFLNNWKKAV